MQLIIPVMEGSKAVRRQTSTLHSLLVSAAAHAGSTHRPHVSTFVGRIRICKLTFIVLSSLSTLKQSSRNDEMIPDFGFVKRLVMKLSGVLMSSSLCRIQHT